MKKIYELKLDKIEFKEEPSVEKNDKGEEIKILKKVEHKIPKKYFVAAPTRIIKEDGQMFYVSEFWKCVKMGVLPANQLARRYVDDGGTLTKEEQKIYNEAQNTLFQKQAEKMALDRKIDKTDEEKKQSETVFNEIIDVFTKLQNYESRATDTLYQNTAEFMAQDKLMLWRTLFLSYEEIDGKDKPLFGDGDLEKRLKRYDEIEAGNDYFMTSVINKLLLVVSLFTLGKAETQEDFDLLLKVQENSSLIEAAQTLGIKEEVKEETKEKEPEIAPKLEEVKIEEKKV